MVGVRGRGGGGRLGPGAAAPGVAGAGGVKLNRRPGRGTKINPPRKIQLKKIGKDGVFVTNRFYDVHRPAIFEPISSCRSGS